MPLALLTKWHINRAGEPKSRWLHWSNEQARNSRSTPGLRLSYFKIEVTPVDKTEDIVVNVLDLVLYLTCKKSAQFDGSKLQATHTFSNWTLLDREFNQGQVCHKFSLSPTHQSHWHHTHGWWMRDWAHAVAKAVTRRYVISFEPTARQSWSIVNGCPHRRKSAAESLAISPMHFVVTHLIEAPGSLQWPGAHLKVISDSGSRRPSAALHGTPPPLSLLLLSHHDLLAPVLFLLATHLLLLAPGKNKIKDFINTDTKLHMLVLGISTSIHLYHEQ